MLDRLHEWRECVDRICRAQQLSQAETTRIKAAMLLPPVRTPSEFASCAATVSKSIAELTDLVQTHQKGYLSLSTYSDAEKDQLESEVGLFVKTCAQQIDRLKLSVVAAQQQRNEQGRPLLNGQAAAHLHGVVLVLAESLQHTTAAFDSFRVQRYQRKKEEQARKKVAGGLKAFLDCGSTLQQGQARPSEKDYWAPSSSEADKRTFTGTSSQEQALMEENRSLVTHLSRTGQSVMHVEQSALEISTLNQLFSTAISSQTAAIEEIYENAVQASEFVRSGNEDLGQAIKINRSTQYYIMVLLLVAAACLLLFDWLNS